MSGDTSGATVTSSERQYNLLKKLIPNRKNSDYVFFQNEIPYLCKKNTEKDDIHAIITHNGPNHPLERVPTTSTSSSSG